MPYPRRPHSNEEHSIIGRWQAEHAHREALQRRVLFLAAIADLSPFEVRLARTIDGFDVVVRQQPQA